MNHLKSLCLNNIITSYCIYEDTLLIGLDNGSIGEIPISIDDY